MVSGRDGMRIGELAATTGLSRDTLRFYERRGLITSLPSPTASNKYRDYPPGTVERLQMVIEAQRAGLPLDDIRTLLAAMEHDDLSATDVDAFLDRRIADLRQTIGAARRVLRLLEATRDGLNAASAGPSAGEKRDVGTRNAVAFDLS